MKNALIKSFLGMFVLINIIFFEDIMGIFYILSDIIWEACNFDLMAIILGCVWAVAFIVFLIQFFRRRDKHDTVEVVEFSCPDDMTPAEVGFLVDGIVDGSDISSLIVYWAGKKYLTISKDKNQVLTRLVDVLPEECKDYEKDLFNFIFAGRKETQMSEVASRLKERQDLMSNVVSKIERPASKLYFNSKTIWLRQFYVIFFAFMFWLSIMYLRLEHYADVVPIIEIVALVATALFLVCSDWLLTYYDYRHKNKSSKGRVASFIVFLILIAGMGVASFFFFESDYYKVVLLLACIAIMCVVVLLNRKMQIYSKAGQEKLGQVLGLRNYINVAEKDRIAMLVEEDPEVFFEILPYASVLGVSDKWIKDFKIPDSNIKIDEETLVNIAILSRFMSSSAFNFARYASFMKVLRVAGTIAVSMGRGGKGSNFGGKRRR